MLEESETSDEILAKTPCYAARAIGCVDFEASTIPDYIFFVEDERAKTIVKHMLNDNAYKFVVCDFGRLAGSG